MENLRGALPDGTSCVLVRADELEAAHQAMAAKLGRETYPGELLGSLAREFGVDRVISVRLTRPLGELLEFAGTGELRARGELPAEARADLEDFRLA